jgi:hypothetical protein
MSSPEMGRGLTDIWARFYHIVGQRKIRRPLVDVRHHRASSVAALRSSALLGRIAYSLRQGLHLWPHRSSRIFCHN